MENKGCAIFVKCFWELNFAMIVISEDITVWRHILNEEEIVSSTIDQDFSDAIMSTLNKFPFKQYSYPSLRPSPILKLNKFIL